MAVKTYVLLENMDANAPVYRTTPDGKRSQVKKIPFFKTRLRQEFTDENGKSSNPMLFNRLIVLEEEINKQIKRIENDENKELLEVVELYFDKRKK